MRGLKTSLPRSPCSNGLLGSELRARPVPPEVNFEEFFVKLAQLVPLLMHRMVYSQRKLTTSKSYWRGRC